jgi:streptogramin lyase
MVLSDRFQDRARPGRRALDRPVWRVAARLDPPLTGGSSTSSFAPVRRLIIAVLAAVVPLAVVGPAGGFLIQDNGGLQSAANGIALGPDGNFWVAEQFSDSLARISPEGAVLQRYAIGDEPHAVADGPGDRVWVAVNGAHTLVWFDAKAASPSPHTVTLPPSCTPDALAPANGRMYFSCGDNANLGYVNDDGSGPATTAAAGGGTVYDLEALGGKLYAPDYSGDVVRRLSKDLAVESTVAIPTAGGAPDGIASDATGTIWVTENASGEIARFPAAQTNGNATEITPAGGTVADPFGIAVGADGRVYVAAKGSHNIVRLDADGTNARFYGLTDGAEPFSIIKGPDDDLWFTDQNHARITRLVNGVPRATTGAATGIGTSSAAVNATVDPRGNEAKVVFDYGPTTGYGQTTGPVTVPNGAGPVAISAAVAGLAAGTTYHVRTRAINGEGETSGADTTFTTAPAPLLGPTLPAPRAPTPRVTARTSFQVRVSSRTHTTVVQKVVVRGLKGTEKATFTCAGKRCPFRTKRFSLTKRTLTKGARSFGRAVFANRNLAGETTISVQITAAGAIGTSTVLQIRPHKKPKIVHRCVQPGAKKATACPT